MTRTARSRVAAVALVLVGASAHISAPAPVAAQVETGSVPVRAVAFRADPLSPEFGRSFDLYVTLRVAPGTWLLLPDTLIPGEASQSAGSGVWTTAPAPGDSVDVVATYPVMGLANGEVQLPTLEAATASVPGPAAVSPLADVVSANVDGGDVRPFALSIGRVQVIPHRVMADVEGVPVVRPPADVSGADWSVWAIGAAVIALGLGGLATYTAIALWGRWSERRKGSTLRRLPRNEALAAIERLLGRGWHREGRVEAFYQEASEIFRGFAARSQASWSEDLTSTELVRQISEREGTGSTKDLRPAVLSGEGVRFGTDRPDSVSAEADLDALARWIAATNSAPGDSDSGEGSSSRRGGDG